MDASDDITGLLHAWRDGDDAARDRLFERCYTELRRVARAVLRRHSGHETLQPTALLHDSLLKLVGAAPDATDRAHFVALVARAMRQVLVDRARRQLAERRGGGAARHVAFDEALDAASLDADPGEIVGVDDALARLAALDPRAAAVAELRVFGGLTIDEVGAALGISPSAVNREWAHARAWLIGELAP